MATVATQVLNNGPKWYTLRVTVTGTDTSNVSDTVIVDASALAVDEVSLYHAQSSLTGFTAKVSWDASTNVDAAHFPEGENSQCWEKYGGLKNNAGAGKTGDVLLSTAGIAANDFGTLTLCFKKSFERSL